MIGIWNERIDTIDFAFQPIVNIHSGICFGFELLLRNHKEAGFNNIIDFFDTAYNDRVLYSVDLMLREKAIQKFKKLEFQSKIKLFYNIDNRVLLMPDYSTGNTCKILERNKLHQSQLCFEISERHDFVGCIESKSILNLYKQQYYKIAVDDFGTGFAGLQLLYNSEPDYVKIDRFFIDQIGTDPRKRLFVSSIVNLAHVLGIEVIAEGVETKKEFYICKEIGCDFVQGYFIQKPQTNLEQLYLNYEIVTELNRTNKRFEASDYQLIQDQMELIEPICPDFHNLEDLFEKFRKEKSHTFFPIVNLNQEPLGIVLEKDLKEYVYSPFGRDLLMNKDSGKKIQDFITRASVSEVQNKVERILEIFTVNENSNGIIITENGKYKGFLSAKALLNAINEKNLAIARDQNPLTKLPGNNMINDYIAHSLKNQLTQSLFVYFDFDFFKPFNDKYGFRCGDRAILVFSDLLKKYSNLYNFFVGHIGGDDFFASIDIKNDELNQYESVIFEIIDKFSQNIKNLYHQEDKENGFIYSNDRQGQLRKFPLLSVSAAIIFIKDKNNNDLSNRFSEIIAQLKKEAKHSKKKYALKIYN